MGQTLSINEISICVPAGARKIAEYIATLVNLLKFLGNHDLLATFLLVDTVSQVEWRGSLEFEHKLHTDFIFIRAL